MPLAPGAEAPDFTLPQHDGDPVTLSDFRGRMAVVLAFHPLSFTGGWTTQLNRFRESQREYRDAGVQILEISVDSAPSQRAFAEQNGGVDFPVLADFHPKGEVARAYGVYNEERGVAGRASFVIDREGVIRDAQTYAPGSLPDPAALLDIARAL